MKTDEKFQELENKFKTMVEELERSAYYYSFEKSSNTYFTATISEDAPVMKVFVQISYVSNDDYDYKFKIGYSKSSVPFSEHDKVNKMEFDSADEAIITIVQRALKINRFFEEL